MLDRLLRWIFIENSNLLIKNNKCLKFGCLFNFHILVSYLGPELEALQQQLEYLLPLQHFLDYYGSYKRLVKKENKKATKRKLINHIIFCSYYLRILKLII